MTLFYNNTPYPVQVDRKNVRNLNAHVRQDGTICVSAPPHVPEPVIQAFLQKHAARLTQASERLSAARQAPVLTDGAALPWLGETLRLRWADRPCPTACAQGVLTVFARTEQEAAYAVAQWKRAECLALYRTLNAETCEAFRQAGYDVPLARIEVKDMTSRWGSCTAAKGRISINFRLMEYPPGCIRGVFCHEYAHFLRQDHSAAFYAVLRDVYPDYDRWDAILKRR